VGAGGVVVVDVAAAEAVAVIVVVGTWVVIEATAAVVGGVVVDWVVVGAVDDDEVTAAVEVVEVAGGASEIGPLGPQAAANRVAARTAVRRTVATLGLPASRIRPKGPNQFRPAWAIEHYRRAMWLFRLARLLFRRRALIAGLTGLVGWWKRSAGRPPYPRS